MNDLDGSALADTFFFEDSGTIESFDGVIDFAGPSGYTSPFSWDPLAEFALNYPDLSIFQNPVTVPIVADAFQTLQNPGNGTYGVSTNILVALCVTYHFQCDTSTERSTWGGVKGLFR